jgi:hypothetical protein
MRILLFITLLLLGFNSFSQSVITELWSKEDSVAKPRPTIPSGYGSLYYNKYKGEWWKVENGVRTKAFNAAGGGGGTVTGSGASNQLTYWSTASAVGALNTSTYPSLTEISYIKGVTSAVQTQLNTKVSGSLTSGYIPKATGTTTLSNGVFYDTGTKVGLGTTTPVGYVHIVAPVNSNTLTLQQSAATAGYQQILFSVAGSTDGTSGNGASIRSTTNRSSNAFSTLEFYTSPDASVSPVKAIHIDGSQNVGIGGVPVTKLDVTGVARASSLTASNLTSGRVPFASTAGAIVDNSSFLFDQSTGRLTSDLFTATASLNTPFAAITNIDLGTTSISGNRAITVKSSTANANLTLTGSQGSGTFALNGANITMTSTNNIAMTATLVTAQNMTISTALKNTALTSGRVATIGTGGLFQDDADMLFDGTYLKLSAATPTWIGLGVVTGGDGYSQRIKGGDGVVGTPTGNYLELQGGPAYQVSGNNNGGNVNISGGAKHGSGTDGDIIIGADGSGVTTVRYIILKGVPTSSAGLPSGAIWSNSGVLTIVP